MYVYFSPLPTRIIAHIIVKADKKEAVKKCKEINASMEAYC